MWTHPQLYEKSIGVGTPTITYEKSIGGGTSAVTYNEKSIGVDTFTFT